MNNFQIVEQKTKTKSSKFMRVALFSVVFSGAILATVVPCFAAVVNTPIDELKTETDKVGGIFDALVGPAVGSTVFAIGAVLVKRIAFS